MAIDVKGLLIKTAGAGGLGLGIYDAHCRAKRSSISSGISNTAKSGLNVWMNTTRLDANSNVENAMKKEAFNWLINSPLPKISGNIRGYVNGFFNSIADNVVPIVLSTGALAAKCGGRLAKCFGAGLGIYLVYAVGKSFTNSVRSRRNP